MSNKASTDGVDFQRQLLFYAVGLVHGKCDYSILYEGNDKYYGALDDVILKINPNDTDPSRRGLYLFQAKQKQDVKYKRSVQDVLHDSKENIGKYIEAYSIYQAHERDGKLTEMIFWTTNDFYETTHNFLAEHTSSESHLVLTIDSIKKYWIKDWKALFMFELAENLAIHAGSSKKRENSMPYKYLNEPLVGALYHEILQPVERSTAAEQPDASTEVKFREEFLQDAPSLSENAKQFRKSFDIACQKLYRIPGPPNNENPRFDITGFKSKIFSTKAFTMGTPTPSNSNSGPVGFSYERLNEEELDWFFKHFIFYVNIPKGDRMVKAIQDLLNDQFNKEMYEKYLITEPQNQAISAKTNKNQQQQDTFLTKSYVQLVMNMIELKRKLAVQPLKGIGFTKESVEKLEANIKSYFSENSNNSLMVVSQSNVEWTAARIKEKFEISLFVSNVPDCEQLLKALNTIQKVPFGGCLRSGEVQYVILLDLPNITQYSVRIVQQVAGAKVIEIVRIEDKNIPMCVTDVLERCDVELDLEQFDIKHVIVDDTNLVLTSYIKEDFIDSVEKITEFSSLSDIIVKSDVYQPDEQHYIKREWINERGEKIKDKVSLITAANTVSIICGTAGQGKTMELLQIAKLAGIVCLYLRSNTIAKGLTQVNNASSLDGFDLLLKLLNIMPDSESEFVVAIVRKCLEQMQTVCLLVDGFDEIVEKYQEVVIKFLLKMGKFKNCRLVIATRDESVPALKNAFKTAAYYTLASFSYETYFRQLWLSDPSELTPYLEENVEIFLSKFDQLLKGAGCKSFLEVPQLCKIIGIIYHERIRKPNIQWHTNYEVGSIYDTFVRIKLDNTLRRLDKMDKLHVWAGELIKNEYYTKHAKLAYELEYNCSSDSKCYEELQRFGLIMMQGDSKKSVNFMHRTVMEYFLVRYFLLACNEKENFLKFLKQYFCVSRANIADKFIDFFLHDMECLSADQKKIILDYTCSDILPTCIRITLNNATFNTLRLLLSVAPKESLAKLCFRFGASSSNQLDNRNEINLKRLGEKQTILLLETLQACDKEYADKKILPRMLFETNPDEEDTLEVAIRKPFPQVFDWVVAYCRANFNSETEHYLNDRLPRYARTLITHCYAENKEKIIDKLLALCESTFTAESVRQCLQNFDLLEELIMSIEIISQGKSFKQDDRLDLVQKILSLLDRYVCQETLLTLKDKSRDKVETLQNEAIKSMLKQWMVRKTN